MQTTSCYYIYCSYRRRHLFRTREWKYWECRAKTRGHHSTLSVLKVFYYKLCIRSVYETWKKHITETLSKHHSLPKTWQHSLTTMRKKWTGNFDNGGHCSAIIDLLVCVCVSVFTSIHREVFICLEQLESRGTDHWYCVEDVSFLHQVPSSLL